MLHSEHKFVHTEPGRCGVAVRFQKLLQIVGVQDSGLRSIPHPIAAEHFHITERTDHHEEVPVERLYAADGLLCILEGIAAIFFHHMTVGEEGHKKIFYAHSAGTGAASSVRGGKGLVQVEVYHVEAHIARTRDPHHGVEVGAVVVVQAARLVDNAGDFQNVFVKQSQRVGICEHQSGGVGACGLAQRVEVHTAVRRGWHIDHFESRHGGGGWIGAMGRVRDEDFGAL